MSVFKKNAYGGLDVYSDKNKFLIHLNADDLELIYSIQQKNYDIDTVMNRISVWVEEQTEQDDNFFADFNSHLFSDDEISTDEIRTKILSDENLVLKIAEEYRFRDDSGYQAVEHPNWWDALNEAISNNVSIKGVMGAILCDKYHKEFEIGQWRVNVVEKGDAYGEKGVLHHNEDKLLVEFYDMSQNKKDFPDGQFTGGRYYLESLLSSKWGLSLDDMVKQGVSFELYGDVKDWAVKPGELNVISAWLTAVQQRFELEKGKDGNTLENTLTEAKERSQQNLTNTESSKRTRDIDK